MISPDSQSGLQLPTRTEAEARIEAALKVARERLRVSEKKWQEGGPSKAAGIAQTGLAAIIAILDAK